MKRRQFHWAAPSGAEEVEVWSCDVVTTGGGARRGTSVSRVGGVTKRGVGGGKGAHGTRGAGGEGLVVGAMEVGAEFGQESFAAELPAL